MNPDDYPSFIDAAVEESYGAVTKSFEAAGEAAANLPGWVPDSDRQKFQEAWAKLLQLGVDNPQVLQWVGNHEANTNALAKTEEDKDVPYYRLAYVPMRHAKDIAYLAYISRISRMKEDEGLVALAGKDRVGKIEKKRQINNAKKQRADALTKLITEIVQGKPCITQIELLRELERLKGHGVIDDIDNEEISYTDKGKSKTAPISGLRSRLSRIKNK